MANKTPDTETAQTVPGGIDPPPAPPPQPGERVPNPAQPYASLAVPQPQDKAAFVAPGTVASGFPKTLYHPVHGGIELADPAEEASLVPRTDWFNTPEEADAHRTYTEAQLAAHKTLTAKLQALEEAGKGVVHNSVQAHQNLLAGRAEPL